MKTSPVLFRALLAACVAAAACGLNLNPGQAAEGPSGSTPARGGSGPGTLDESVQSLLKTYCVSCHGPTKQKGERRLDRIDGVIVDDESLVDLQDILDQLNL